MKIQRSLINDNHYLVVIDDKRYYWWGDHHDSGTLEIIGNIGSGRSNGGSGVNYLFFCTGINVL